MEGIYKINIIPNDLSVEETILQIADSLDNLNGIVDDVFNRISTRICQNMEKTAKLRERIDVSRAKIEKLTGMQKAIEVFSSAKYPSSIVHEHYKSIFDGNSYHYQPKTVTLSGRPQRSSNEKGIQEKLHFFHVKVAEPKTVKPKQDDLNTVIGKISSVGELLVFNTEESPYVGRPAKQQAYVPRVHTDVKTNVLDEAPPSIMKRNVLKREVDEYMYAPGIGMVPELDMPLDLPDLPGVAGDIQYSFTEDGTIAPSAVTSPVAHVPPELAIQLPDVKPDEEDLIPDEPESLPPPPSMPMPVTVPVTLVPVTQEPVPMTSTVPMLSMPSPPPPPPPPPPMDFATPVKTSQELPSTPSPGGGDAHASLMAAIRQAGGAGRAKLRPAADNNTDQVSKSKPSIGGDLMADLHAKLSMRRRGISGAERAGGTVLHTLASVIPEPGDQSSQQSSSGEDWE